MVSAMVESLRRRVMVGINLREDFFPLPLLDGGFVVAEQLAQNLLVVGAEAIWQPQRFIRHTAENDAATGDFKRADERIRELCEIISRSQLRIVEQIGTGLHDTGGHTRGCTSWSFRVRDGDRLLNVVSACDLGRLATSRYPEQEADLERSFAVLRGLPADIWVT